ncbi:hypothetical protein FHW83_005069 [Duganella sp. SG902]|uniref:hypothetical protein n=1 Tax=Duganella sp. SG902 TaxID=2587016 RepID=UPI00159E0E5E|nr:hypothetical protein [Duganella sp. SG902]NVM79232.1 hypothetical protein [Duganella sp. SG902]
MHSAGKSSEIDLEQAAEGMTLASALLDANGSVLLPQDAPLTAAVLAALRRRGIDRCVVWSEEDAPDPAELARQRALRLQRLEHLFRHCADAAGSQALLAQLRNYRQEQA